MPVPPSAVGCNCSLFGARLMEGQGMGVGGRVYLCYPGSASVLGQSYAPELQERGFLSMSVPTPYEPNSALSLWLVLGGQSFLSSSPIE